MNINMCINMNIIIHAAGPPGWPLVCVCTCVCVRVRVCVRAKGAVMVMGENKQHSDSLPSTTMGHLGERFACNRDACVCMCVCVCVCVFVGGWFTLC